MLMKDIKFFDLFYEKMLNFYDELVFYIVVGEVKIVDLDVNDILVKEVVVEVVEEKDKVMVV